MPQGEYGKTILCHAVFFLSLIAGFTCSAALGGDLSRDLMKQDQTKFGDFRRPTAQWAGRLVLPEPSERQPDGAVMIVVANAPRRELIGRTLWVRWNMDKPWDKWFSEYSTDISIPGDLRAKSLEKGLVIPLRLDGWKKVSPLESLCGTRDGDDMLVELESPELKGDSIYISRDPVQISGFLTCLVSFDGPNQESLRKVRHFNPASGKFDGPAEIVSIPIETSHGDNRVPMGCTRDIEKSELNGLGWYAYGNMEDGVFSVKALEPRALLRVKPEWVVSGRKKSDLYFSSVHHSKLVPGLARTTLLAPGEDLDPKVPSEVSSHLERTWPMGAMGLVFHIFGWRESSSGGLSKFMGIVPGHFSFGLAEVVRDPFTGEKRFDIRYRQVYAHNPNGIVSGTLRWHAYMGDLERGWMYSLPVSDTVVRMQCLDPYDFGGWKINPFLGFARELEKMTALYRCGAGQGVCMVRPDVSCVQDSNCALYSSLKVFDSTIASTGAVKKWLSGDPEDRDIKRFLELKVLVKEVERSITTLGIAQGKWREYLKNPLGARNSGPVRGILDALVSSGTAFPRSGHDSLTRVAVARSYPMMSFMSAMVGGSIPGLRPLAPSSPFVRNTEGPKIPSQLTEEPSQLLKAGAGAGIMEMMESRRVGEAAESKIGTDVNSGPLWADVQRPAEIVSKHGDGILTIGNVRFGFDTGQGGGIEARFRTVKVEVDEIESVYYYLRPFPPEWIAAHGLLIFKFREGHPAVSDKGEKTQFLTLSVEPRYYKGQSYGYSFGKESPKFYLVFQIGTLDDYRQVCRIIHSDRLLRYRLNLDHGASGKLLANCLQASEKMTGLTKSYHVYSSNCINNLFYLINTVMPMERQFMKKVARFLSNPLISIPYLSVRALRSYKMIAEELPVEYIEGAGVGRIPVAQLVGPGLHIARERARVISGLADRAMKKLAACLESGKKPETLKSLLFNEVAGYSNLLHVPGVNPGEKDSAEFLLGDEFGRKLDTLRLASAWEEYMAGVMRGFSDAAGKRLARKGPDCFEFMQANLNFMIRELDAMIGLESHRQ